MRIVTSIVCLIALALAGSVLRAADEKPKPSNRDKVEQGAPLPLDEAAKAMTLPPGFTATLFAGEPDIHQPIGLTVDHRGRLWVCENDSYPRWEEHGKDRIVIFEDTDGDGKQDKRTVFAEGFHYITSVLPCKGGVYVMDCPNLLFFPVKEGEDHPSGAPQVILDGWNWKGVHNLPNSLTWGPDGWLYGCHGITVDSLVGLPGSAEKDRTRVSCGVWRYHPVKKQFEYICAGTTNPWGLDYDERGQMFMSNNVVAHLWHVIQGSHYERMHGKDINPYSFELMKTCADHLHWGGGDWTKSRTGEQNSVAGGGHSHAGLMIYLGDAFPSEYRGTLFMGNTHGHRLNNDSLARKGSGYSASHRPDFLMANDKWFKAVSVKQGPAGDCYVIDWSDTGECHDYDVTDRAHARMYRVAYEGTKPVKVDLEKETDDKLVDMQLLTNEWYVRHAREVLRDRAPLKGPIEARLIAMAETDKDPVHRLRAMWMLHMCGADGEEARLLKSLGDSDEYVRAWAVQLLAEDRAPSAAALEKFGSMAKDDASPFVRLYLASAMQRTPLEQRKPILEALCAHGEDAADANLPLMYYYALEPVVGADPKAAATMLGKIKIPKVRELAVRRMAAK
jgi:putative membrane-bound dehydrogenase-like protein